MLIIVIRQLNGEGGIRTHAPLRTNGFQDRLVMTTSIPLHQFGFIIESLLFCCRSVAATSDILSPLKPYVNTFFEFFLFFLFKHFRGHIFPSEMPQFQGLPGLLSLSWILDFLPVWHQFLQTFLQPWCHLL